MKKYEFIYSTGIILSLVVGIWHFFVPLMFQWFSYIPNQYENLIVGINWTNLCFSFLLTGISAILFIWRKKFFSHNPEALTIYAFLIITWIFRVGLAVFNPWSLEPIIWAAYGQFIASVFIMLALLIPFIKIITANKYKE